jgi:DNA gyrase subunit A
MLISTGGTVIKMPVEDVKRLGRSTQGVIVMRLRGDETVSALAPVVESEEQKDGDGDGAPTASVDLPDGDTAINDDDGSEDESGDDEPEDELEPDEID